jgi:diguanylate cyclase (GGDEF)-like protein/PAS domain S-box-containing protein
MEPTAKEEQRLLEFLYAAPVGLVQFDMAGDISMMNPHAMKHLLPLAGARNSSNLFAIFESCAPELRNMLYDFSPDRGHVCDGHRIMVDLGRYPRGGEPKVLACTLVKIDQDRAIACIADVSLQVAQERRLKQAETWFASLVHDVRDYAILSVTPSGAVDAANSSWAKQTGYSCDEILGRLLSDVFPSSAAEGGLVMAEQLHVAARDGWHLEEGWHDRMDGSRYWSQRLLAARTGPSGELAGYTLVLREALRHTHHTDDLRRLLTQDHLTGAANRARFQQVFEREQRAWLENGKHLSLLMLDIDHFKRVNDTYGHPTGDLVLSSFAKVIGNALRPTDLLARLGGEEFAILLPATSLVEAVDIADELRLRVADMVVPTAEGAIRITASFGCATAGRETDLVGAADAALYDAKAAGRNRVNAAAQPSIAA